MNLYIYLFTALFSLSPILELRGAIPYAIYNGMNPVFAYFFCVFFNALLGPIIFFFLSSIHKPLYGMEWYKNLFDRIIINARKKLEKKIEKNGYLGIMLFVAIPLPVTGAVTGTFGAWALGMSRKKTCLAVWGGVCISGIIVTLLTLAAKYYTAGWISFFIRMPH